MEPGRVHLLCGLVGAGKTTYARALARDLPAVRFSRDEWMLRLYGLPYSDPAYASLSERCTSLMWSIAVRVLSVGRDVVLDWNQWSRERRAHWRDRALAAGSPVRLHFIDVPVEVAIRQAEGRKDPSSHALSADAVRHFATIFEPPEADEGLDVSVVRSR